MVIKFFHCRYSTMLVPPANCTVHSAQCTVHIANSCGKVVFQVPALGNEPHL